MSTLNKYFTPDPQKLKVGSPQGLPDYTQGELSDYGGELDSFTRKKRILDNGQKLATPAEELKDKVNPDETLSTPAQDTKISLDADPAQKASQKNFYDAEMERLAAEDAKAYALAREGYKNNANRAMWMNNASLIGDLAHLGTQIWAAKTQGTKSFNPIKSDDKYLQQAEAWRQKLNQSYIDEVVERNKTKRAEINQRRLYDWRADDLDYKNKKQADDNAYKNRSLDINEADKKADNERADKVAESQIKKNENQIEVNNARQADNHALTQSKIVSNNVMNSRRQQIMNQPTTDQIISAFNQIIREHPELQPTKTVNGEVVKDERPTLITMRQVIDNYNHSDVGSHEQTAKTVTQQPATTTASSQPQTSRRQTYVPSKTAAQTNEAPKKWADSEI